MTTLRIEGGRPLRGEITVGGNKNAALPILAATLLTSEECVIDNVPRIRDVAVMCDLLRSVGAEVDVHPRDGVVSTVTVRARSITADAPPDRLVGQLRGSVLLLGSLLARTGAARLASPGGDFPSKRNLKQHHAALVALGAEVRDGGFTTALPIRGGSFYMLEASVTATEVALLAAAGAGGSSEIRHAACEPHVVELARALQRMGARVSGAGTPTLVVEPAKALRGFETKLEGDAIEAGSWVVAAAATRGDVDVLGATEADLEPIVAALRTFGVDCAWTDGRLRTRGAALRSPGRLTTGLWPAFPSDLVSLMTVLATQSEGATLIHDWMYELRLFALDQLAGMGADLFLCDPHRILVNGPRTLKGRTLDSRDIRSGMAVIVAALAAEGTSRVLQVETVERGYADLKNRLEGLGAAIAEEP